MDPINQIPNLADQIEDVLARVERVGLRVSRIKEALDPPSITAIVGDPRNRQDVRPYRALVDCKAARFRAARRKARACLRHSGEWPLGGSLLALTIRGECAIAWLRFAGVLRPRGLVEVIDVVRHAATVDGLAARLEQQIA